MITMPSIVISLAVSAGLVQEGSVPDTPPAEGTSTAPVLIPEMDSVTEHEMTVDGKVLRYKATAGTLPLFEESSGEVKARIFFVSYERLEPQEPSSSTPESTETWSTPDPATRPVTFCFNGGTGSSSVWLHLGA